MKADPLSVVRKFHDKRLLLDTNLLLPYFMGCFYRVHQQVPRHGSFKEEEFELLAQIIEYFKKAGKVLTTPHLLTEVSNVSEGLRENRFVFLAYIRPLIQQLDEVFEARRVGAHRLSGRDYFLRFGLADAVVIDLAYDPLLVLTNDKPMARYLQEEKKKQNVVYFGDLKDQCLGQ